MTRLQQRSIVPEIATVAVAMFLLLPLVVVVAFSFNSTASLSFPMTGLSLRWYEQLFSAGPFRDAFVYSLILASVVAITTLVLGTAAAYGLPKVAGRLRPLILLLFFIPITIPGLFLGVSLLSIFTQVHMALSFWTVALAHLVFVFPYFFLIAQTAIERLDPSLEEAASDLGAPPWTVFRRITLPQVGPLLLSATALAFMLSMDEFVMTFFVIGRESTLPLYIFSEMRREVTPAINAVSTLLLGFTLLVWVVGFGLAVRSRRASQRIEAWGGGSD